MMMLGRIYPQNESTEESDVLAGEIYTYYNLDSSSPWFNIERNEEALDAEIEELSIPGNLKPHLSKFLIR